MSALELNFILRRVDALKTALDVSISKTESERAAVIEISDLLGEMGNQTPGTYVRRVKELTAENSRLRDAALVAAEEEKITVANYEHQKQRAWAAEQKLRDVQVTDPRDTADFQRQLNDLQLAVGRANDEIRNLQDHCLNLTEERDELLSRNVGLQQDLEALTQRPVATDKAQVINALKEVLASFESQKTRAMGTYRIWSDQRLEEIAKETFAITNAIHALESDGKASRMTLECQIGDLYQEVTKANKVIDCYQQTLADECKEKMALQNEYHAAAAKVIELQERVDVMSNWSREDLKLAHLITDRLNEVAAERDALQVHADASVAMQYDALLNQ